MFQLRSVLGRGMSPLMPIAPSPLSVSRVASVAESLEGSSAKSIQRLSRSFIPRNTRTGSRSVSVRSSSLPCRGCRPRCRSVRQRAAPPDRLEQNPFGVASTFDRQQTGCLNQKSSIHSICGHESWTWSSEGYEVWAAKDLLTRTRLWKAAPCQASGLCAGHTLSPFHESLPIMPCPFKFGL